MVSRSLLTTSQISQQCRTVLSLQVFFSTIRWSVSATAHRTHPFPQVATLSARTLFSSRLHSPPYNLGERSEFQGRECRSGDSVFWGKWQIILATVLPVWNSARICSTRIEYHNNAFLFLLNSFWFYLVRFIIFSYMAD